MKKKIVELLKRANKQSGNNLIVVDVESYVDKILKNSSIISIIESGVLKGFISYYANDKLKEIAYLTMIVVSEDCQGFGYGRSLIQLSIKNLKKIGFKNYKLEVNKSNLNAIALYKDLGFENLEDGLNSLYMSLKL